MKITYPITANDYLLVRNIDKDTITCSEYGYIIDSSGYKILTFKKAIYNFDNYNDYKIQ